MSQHFVEILIFFPSVLATGFLIFIAGVLQKVMNQSDESDFQNFLKRLEQAAIHSPYAVGVSSITFVAMIPYWIIFGFSNFYFSLGLILFVVASIVSKSFNLPIYKKIFALENSDKTNLNIERKKLQKANLLRATIQFISAAVMLWGLK